MKNLLSRLLACLIIPLAAQATEPPKPVVKPVVKPVAKPASAPAHAAVPGMSASSLRAELVESKHRRNQLGDCQKKSSDQRLSEHEGKTFLTACMAGK